MYKHPSRFIGRDDGRGSLTVEISTDGQYMDDSASDARQSVRLAVLFILKGKGFPYSLPSVGPGAHLGVQAVSPQVTDYKSSTRR